MEDEAIKPRFDSCFRCDGRGVVTGGSSLDIEVFPLFGKGVSGIEGLGHCKDYMRFVDAFPYIGAESRDFDYGFCRQGYEVCPSGHGAVAHVCKVCWQGQFLHSFPSGEGVIADCLDRGRCDCVFGSVPDSFQSEVVDFGGCGRELVDRH